MEEAFDAQTEKQRKDVEAMKAELAALREFLAHLGIHVRAPEDCEPHAIQ